MFANPEVQVAAGGACGLKVSGTRESEPRFRRRREVGGAADQPRQVGRDSVQDFRGRIASGNSLRVGRKNGNVLRPIGWQLPLLNLVKLGCEFWEFLSVLAELLFPLLARFAASSSNARFEMLVDSAGNKKLGIGGPTV